MYDCLHLRFALRPEEAGYAAFQASAAVQQGTITRHEPTRWQVRYRGMRLDYWPLTGRGRIRGSLHTFWHGHNSGSFLASEIPLAGLQLAAAFGLPADALAVEHLEVGVNLPLASAPTSFLDTLLTHKGSRFYPQEPPAGTTRPLLFVATHLDYRVKAYDKGKYNRVQGTATGLTSPHLLRFEVVYTRARPLQRLLQCAALTLEAVTQPVAVLQLAQALLQHWHSVEHGFEPDFTGLAFSDMLLLQAATAPALWKAGRSGVAARTLTRHRARSRHLRQLAEQNSPLAEYHECFTRQLSRLLDTLTVESSGEAVESLSTRQTATAKLLAPAWPRFHTCNQSELHPVQVVPTPGAPRPCEPACKVPPHSSKPAYPGSTPVVVLPGPAHDLLQPADGLGLLFSTTPFLKPTHHEIEIKPYEHHAWQTCRVTSCATLQTTDTYLIHNHLHTELANKQARPPPACPNHLTFWDATTLVELL